MAIEIKFHTEDPSPPPPSVREISVVLISLSPADTETFQTWDLALLITYARRKEEKWLMRFFPKVVIHLVPFVRIFC